MELLQMEMEMGMEVECLEGTVGTSIVCEAGHTFAIGLKEIARF